MQLIEFPDYKSYVDIQKWTVGRRGIGPFFHAVAMKKMCRWMKWYRRRDGKPLNGICHGARNGLEADEFTKHFPGSTVIGTDLFPHSGRSANYSGFSEVIEWDFSEQKEEWIGVFDFVYSNSLDHARDPLVCLRVWLDQLKPKGCMFIQWGMARVKASGGDCFGATIPELIRMINEVGKVVELLYVKAPYKDNDILQRRGLETITLVALKKT